MAQRKKKPGGYQKEVISKAHHKNEFMKKLKHYINSCCNEDIFSLIPHKFLEPIYILRCHSLALAPVAGLKIPAQLLNYQKRVLSEYVRKERLEISNYKYGLSIDDFFTVGLTAFYLPRRICDNDFPKASLVKAALLNHCHDDEHLDDLAQRLNAFFDALVWIFSNLKGILYWFEYELKITDEGNSGMKNVIEIHTDLPEIIHIKTNGKVRPAIRLCWPESLSGIKLIWLNPSLLGIKDSVSDEPLPVYVQSHVLGRLAERIDSLDPGLAQYHMYVSFRDPKVFCDTNHNLLIEYRIFNTKAGYFRIDVIDGRILVRTFLFLTQSGTPEGYLLWKNTGLKKLDKKYLAIDKLSNFMSSDIGDNQQIRKVFEDCGCQSLIELNKQIDVICTKHSSQSTSKLMIDYLGYNTALVPEEVFEDNF
jgi:uncharacterized protein YqkB